MNSACCYFDIVMEIEFTWQLFFKNPHIIFHVTPSGGSRIVPCGWTCVSFCVVKAGELCEWTSLSSSVLCPGLSPDHVERIHQLDSWQTSAFSLSLIAQMPGDVEFFRMGGLGSWVFCYFVWVSRLSSRPGVGLWYNLWRQHFATYITPASGLIELATAVHSDLASLDMSLYFCVCLRLWFFHFDFVWFWGCLWLW